MANLKHIFDEVIEDKIRTIPGKADLIKTARDRGRLLAVRGTYDYVEQVVPHCYAAEKKIIQPGPSPPNLADYDVVFVGCPGSLTGGNWRKPLTAFVEAGGVLLTTDWCLENLIEKTFPKTIAKRGTAQGTFPLRVRMPGHPLLEGIPKCSGTPWVVKGRRIALASSTRSACS